MISSRASVERALKQCSFSQSWVGGMLCDGYQTVRPALLVFASESGSQLLASELVPQPLDLCRVGIWLDKCFALHGPPQELLVPTLEVLESIRYRYPSTRLRVQPASQVLQDSIHTLTADFREHVPHSLVKRFGETKAAEIFQAAHSFSQARPWRSLQDNVVVRFGVGQVDHYLMLGGYCRENEQGIYLFRRRADIFEELLMASYSPGGSLFVHHRDLNLVDKLGLVLERQKYPMFMAEEMPPGKAVLKDLLWLLRRLPDFAKDQMPMEDGRRRLAVTEERVDNWFGRSGSWTQAFNSAA